MAKLELSEETRKGMEGAGQADLMIAIAAPVNADQLRTAAVSALQSLPGRSPDSGVDVGPSAVIALPGTSGAAVSPTPGTAAQVEPGLASSLRFLPYQLPPGPPPVISWLPSPATYQMLFGMARELGASACAIVGFDLAVLKRNQLAPLMAPVLTGGFDLAMAVYPQGKFEGLLNSSILAPLARALYGRRVRFPLAPDFVVSAQMLPDLENPSRRSASLGPALFWPSTEAALKDRRICQVRIDAQHLAATDGVDLSTVLSETVGPLFAEMEADAALWQRVRGSQPVENAGPAVPTPADGATVDVRPMIDAFQVGFGNLGEVWSLVLPPVTLLDLKRMSRMSTEAFRMPDELWVRIVYDFALAYRLRTLSRSHLLGALTPLYLGWVASHVQEVAGVRPSEAEQRVERLARAYEEGKPYLLSRWRWPDRFNP